MQFHREIWVISTLRRGEARREMNEVSELSIRFTRLASNSPRLASSRLVAISGANWKRNNVSFGSLSRPSDAMIHQSKKAIWTIGLVSSFKIPSMEDGEHLLSLNVPKHILPRGRTGVDEWISYLSQNTWQYTLWGKNLIGHWDVRRAGHYTASKLQNLESQSFEKCRKAYNSKFFFIVLDWYPSTRIQWFH